MQLGIKEKLAVVTGASRGLGRAAAEALGHEGARVVLVARGADALETAAADLRAKGIDAVAMSADLTDKDQVTDLFRRVRAIGSPEILVYNNAGARDLDFDDASDDDFLHAYQIMVMGYVWCVREIVDDMKAAKWGRIVVLGSLCAKEPHKEFPMVLHNTGRPAQLGFSKTLSNEIAKFGITVNTIGTGMLDHDGEATERAYAVRAGKRGISMRDVQRFRVAPIPVGRAGRGDELGSLCAFLCSDRAAFINGQMILLDGGRIASLI